MVISRDEFVEKWKAYIAGLSLFGFVGQRDGSTLAQASKIWQIPEDSRKLLVEMYNGLGVVEMLLKDAEREQEAGRPRTLIEAIEFLKALPDDVKLGVKKWIVEGNNKPSLPAPGKDAKK